MSKMIRRLYSELSAWAAFNPPGALSSKGWRLFKREFKEKAPIRYYFYYDFRYNVIWPIKHKFEALSDWIRYRFINKFHVINLELEPNYYSVQERILHSNFKLLKDFVEVESAYHYLWSHPHLDKNRKSFLYRNWALYRRWKNRNLRYPELGVAHYEWAATLDDPSLPHNDRCEHQAVAAREILALYRWWTQDRPSRKSIEPAPYKRQGKEGLSQFDDDFDRDAPDFKKWQEDYTKAMEQEEEWEKEDSEMLIRLVKIRHELWT